MVFSAVNQSEENNSTKTHNDRGEAAEERRMKQDGGLGRQRKGERETE